MSDNMFEIASRLKLRFQTDKGNLAVEDLWDLPLTSNSGRTSLDSLARDRFNALKQADESVSFVAPATKADPTLQLSFDIVKRIIDVKVAERNEREEARVKAEKKQKIMALIEQKENAALEGQSLDDLRKQLEAL